MQGRFITLNWLFQFFYQIRNLHQKYTCSKQKIVCSRLLDCYFRFWNQKRKERIDQFHEWMNEWMVLLLLLLKISFVAFLLLPKIHSSTKLKIIWHSNECSHSRSFAFASNKEMPIRYMNMQDTVVSPLSLPLFLLLNAFFFLLFDFSIYSQFTCLSLPKHINVYMHIANINTFVHWFSCCAIVCMCFSHSFNVEKKKVNVKLYLYDTQSIIIYGCVVYVPKRASELEKSLEKERKRTHLLEQ